MTVAELIELLEFAHQDDQVVIGVPGNWVGKGPDVAKLEPTFKETRHAGRRAVSLDVTEHQR